jgi:hypothetical protein
MMLHTRYKSLFRLVQANIRENTMISLQEISSMLSRLEKKLYQFWIHLELDVDGRLRSLDEGVVEISVITPAIR